tara:strand:+ start:182 stop:526 length:345 start_codon:yes stop_codon:yes gene_type:complete
MALNTTDCFGNNYADILREAFPKGATAFTTVRHVARSGMSRRISVLATSIRSGDGSISNYSYAVSQVLGWKHGPSRESASVKVSGCGMDMGFHLVYTLSSILYGDGYAIKQRWI